MLEAGITPYMPPKTGYEKTLMGAFDVREGFMLDADGSVIYGQVQELSKAWFDDLDKYADVKADASAAWQGPALVIWGTDDEAVNPAVSAAVADALGAQTFEATGEGHGYGFYSEDDAVRNAVAGAVAAFFAENLK